MRILKPFRGMVLRVSRRRERAAQRDSVAHAFPKRSTCVHLEHLECSRQPHIQGRGAKKRTQHLTKKNFSPASQGPDELPATHGRLGSVADNWCCASAVAHHADGRYLGSAADNRCSATASAVCAAARCARHAWRSSSGLCVGRSHGWQDHIHPARQGAVLRSHEPGAAFTTASHRGPARILKRDMHHAARE